MLISPEEWRIRVTKNLPPLSRFPKRKRSFQRLRKSAFFWPAMLPLTLLSAPLINWIFLAQQVYAAPQAPTAQGGHLTFQQYVNEGQRDKASHGKLVRPHVEKPKKIPHPTGCATR